MALDAAGRAFVEAHLGLVKAVAFKLRFHDGYMTMDDHIQEGYLGLIDAALKNARGQYVSTTYLKIRIRGQMLDAMRTLLWGRRVDAPTPVSTELVDLETSAYSVLDDYTTDAREVAAGFGVKLSDREAYILNRLYWDERTLKEIGRELGVTEARVCQVKTGILARLREAAVSSRI